MNCQERKEKTEKELNNSYQIQEEFKCKNIKQSMYYPPRKMKIATRYPQSSRIKVYTEEEIFKFEMERLGSLFNNLSICGN